MLIGVRLVCADPHASLDQLCRVVEPVASLGPRKRARTHTQGSNRSSSGRHVRWKRDAEYVCVRAGRPFANAAELDQQWAQGRITLADMYLVKHGDETLSERSPHNPQWEALYYLSDRREYVRVQKRHLKTAYEEAGRMDKEQAWSMVNDEDITLPYWIDRHLFSVLKIK